MKAGDTVTMYSPGWKREHESWTRGVIRETLPDKLMGVPVHVVTINGFKWDREAAFGPYDGVPEVIACEAGCLPPGELQFLNQWPVPVERIAWPQPQPGEPKPERSAVERVA